MKSVLTLLLLGAAGAGFAQATCDANLASYKACSGLRGTNVVDYEDPDVFAENGLPADGIVGVTSGPVDGVKGFTRATAPDASGSYLEYTLFGRAGDVLRVGGLALGYSRDGGGPRQLVVRSSADGFAADLFVDEDISTDAAEYNYPTFASPVEGEQLTFRIYLFDAGHGDYDGIFYLRPFAGSTTALQVRGCVVSPLPVELTSFGGVADGQVADLTWATASERDNDYFAVELSPDGSDFVEVGRVVGSGTTGEANAYDFAHRTNRGGTHYFRLRQVDFDGEQSYSQVVAVEFEGRARLGLANTVAREQLVVDAEEATPYRILDLSGDVALSGTLTGGRESLDVANLSPGVYVLSGGATALRFVR